MVGSDVAGPGSPADGAVLRAVLRDVLAVEEEVAARVADDLSTVLTVDRPDWAGRVGDVLARVGAGFPEVEDAEFRRFVDLVADVHLANPSTWPDLRWHPGRTTPTAGVDDVAAGFRTPGEVGDRYDVVVVGSGAGGGVAAWKLAESGRRVLLVERGDWPGTVELSRDHLRNPRAATGLDPLTGPRGAEDPRTLAGRVLRPGDGGWNANAMLVGGGTRVYGAQAWRFAPDDFRMATRYGVPDGSALADWPIGYADLEPYYDEIEWTLGVSGRAEGDTAAGPRRRPYPMPPLPGGVQERLLAAGAATLGLSTTAVPLLVNTQEFGGRAACARCAQCVGFACPVDAKTGTHNTAVPWAVASGNCDVVLGARVDRVLPGTAGRVAGVALLGRDPRRGPAGPGVPLGPGRGLAVGLRRVAGGAPSAAGSRAERRSAPGGDRPDGNGPRAFGDRPVRAGLGLPEPPRRRRVPARHQRRGEPGPDGPRRSRPDRRRHGRGSTRRSPA